MYAFEDMVKCFTSTEGDGAIALGAPIPGFFHPDDAIKAQGKPAVWLVTDNPLAPSQWEVFAGQWTEGAPNTISRGALVSSSTGSRISFDEGVKTLSLVWSEEQANGIFEVIDSDIETGGSAGAYTVQSRRNAPPVEGTTIRVKANHSAPSGGCTVSWNGASAVALLDRSGAPLGENSILEDNFYTLACDGAGAFRVIDAEATAANAGFMSAEQALIVSRPATGTAGQINVGNGDGVAGPPVFSLPSALVAPGSLKAKIFFTDQVVIPDDGVLVLSLANHPILAAITTMHLVGRSGGAGGLRGSITVRTGVGAGLGVISNIDLQGSNITLTNAVVLTGTTGTDGYWTISANDDGNVYIENRRGAPLLIAFSIGP